MHRTDAAPAGGTRSLIGGPDPLRRELHGVDLHGERGKPVALPTGTAPRKGRLWGSGYRRREQAKAAR